MPGFIFLPRLTRPAPRVGAGKSWLVTDYIYKKNFLTLSSNRLNVFIFTRIYEFKKALPPQMINK